MQIFDDYQDTVDYCQGNHRNLHYLESKLDIHHSKLNLERIRAVVIEVQLSTTGMLCTTQWHVFRGVVFGGTGILRPSVVAWVT